MLKLFSDLTQESTSTAGTGTITLAQLAGWMRFRDRFTNGDQVYYSIQNGYNWELGLGGYIANDQLSRGTILQTLNAGVVTIGGAALTLSGVSVVRAVAPETFLTTTWRVNPVIVAGSQGVTPGNSYLVTANSVTLTLPASPTVGDRLEVVQAGSSITGTVVNPNGGKINATTGNMTIDIDNYSLALVYVDASYGWKVVA